MYDCCFAPTKVLCHIFQTGKMEPKTARTITLVKKQPVVMLRSGLIYEKKIRNQQNLQGLNVEVRAKRTNSKYSKGKQNTHRRYTIENLTSTFPN